MSEACPHDLCVLRNLASQGWNVVLCDGNHAGQILGTFPLFSAAADFAIEERARRAGGESAINRIHFPDDCPCHRQGACPGRSTQV